MTAFPLAVTVLGWLVLGVLGSYMFYKLSDASLYAKCFTYRDLLFFVLISGTGPFVFSLSLILSAYAFVDPYLDKCIWEFKDESKV